MSKRRSYFKNYSTPSLIAVLKQREEELERIKEKDELSPLLKKRIVDLDFFIKSVKNLLIERYLDNNLSLNELGKRILNSTNTLKDVYKEVFTLKLLEANEPIDIELFEEVMEELDINHIQMIMYSKKDTIYEKLASQVFDQMIFDVDKDVYDDLIKKNESDEREKEIEKELEKEEVPSIFTIEDTISIGRYVNEYLNIPGDCKELYHSGLKDLNSPYVMGVDNNYANKNPELVYQGYLLLVMDANGNRGTYVNPFYLDRLMYKEDVERELNTYYQKVAIDLSKLNEYFNKFSYLKREAEINNEVENVLNETKKIKKFQRLKKERKRNEEY